MLHTGRSSKALECFEENLKIYRNHDDLPGIGKHLNNIASAYLDLGCFDKSLEFCEQSLKIFKELGYHSRIAEVLSKYGECYLNLENPEKAYHYFQKVADMGQKLINPQEIISCRYHMGVIRVFHLGEIEEGKQNLETALEMAKKENTIDLIALSLLALGKLYFRDRKITLAKEHCRECVEISQPLFINQVLIECYYQLAKIAQYENSISETKKYKKKIQSQIDTILENTAPQYHTNFLEKPVIKNIMLKLDL